ncbi:hypothetical protein [Paenibacillus qinlingensis]|uniref:hypothetical protein n=1 Tax=Paenibacillus qinlingensis TaxID=1837343 RepID=UPI001FEAA372|nr:hypothetical protein [Paenibacillus qinlingensis]
MENRADHVKTLLRELRGTVSKPISKKLDLHKCERVVEKLGSFSSSCKDCQQQLLELMNYFILIKENIDRIDDTKLKQYKQLINHITSHLQIKHKLIQEGYYLGIFMSLGMSLGVVFGITVFDNIGLGISIGMCMGLAIGAGKDADAKKKGKTI